MIQLSDSAKEQVQKLLDAKAKEGAVLRLGVKGGGCSGLTYDVQIDHVVRPDDRVFESSGVKIVCDPKSFVYLNGLLMDYSSALVGGGFQFRNPNATGSCGCGTSFSV